MQYVAQILKMRSSDITSRYGYPASPSRVSMKMHRASPSSLPKPSKEKQTPKALCRIKHLLCMRPRTVDEEPMYTKMPSKLWFQRDRTSDFGRP